MLWPSRHSYGDLCLTILEYFNTDSSPLHTTTKLCYEYIITYMSKMVAESFDLCARIQFFRWQNTHGELSSSVSKHFVSAKNGSKFSRRESKGSRFLGSRSNRVFSLGDSIAQMITNDHDSALVGSFCHNPRTVNCQAATAQQRHLAIVLEFW